MMLQQNIKPLYGFKLDINADDEKEKRKKKNFNDF